VRIPQAGVVVRTAEIAFGLLWAVPSCAWILFVGRHALQYGLGWGITPDTGGCLQTPNAPVLHPGDAACLIVGSSFPPQADVGRPFLALFGPLALLGVIPLLLGLAFILGVGPLAKPRDDVALSLPRAQG
jgi:hypothetical protein